MIICCKHNFSSLENDVEANKHVEGGKFLDTTKALFKVSWLSKRYENQEVEFIVTYTDRFVGLVDMPIEEFLETEIPYHRIKLFKRDGVIIWDRKKKYTIL